MTTESVSPHQGLKVTTLILSLLGLAGGLFFLIGGLIEIEVPQKPGFFDFRDLFLLAATVVGSYVMAALGCIGQLTGSLAVRPSGHRTGTVIWCVANMLALAFPFIVGIFMGDHEFPEALKILGTILTIGVLPSSWILGGKLLSNARKEQPGMHRTLWINLACLLSPIIMLAIGLLSLAIVS